MNEKMVSRGICVAPGNDELLRLVIESATDFAIFSLDQKGFVSTWNSGAERLLGYAEDEILGRTADIIFTPEDQAAGIPNEERRQASANGRAEDERWTMRKDTSRFWASGLMMPLADPSRGFVKVFRDRTSGHQAEAKLRESEARFRLLATSIPQLVFRTRNDGWRTWGSPQWIAFTGLSLDESLGLGWLDAVHPDDREQTQAAWTDARHTGGYYAEHRVRRIGNGEYRWHQTRARPVHGPEDTDWVGTMTDIHDLRSLKDRQQMLMGELQHRTRNLLAVVQAIGVQTQRTSNSLEEFGTEFESRLRALSRVQSLLAQVEHDEVHLGDLVAAELAAHGGAEFPRKARVEGGPVSLPASSAQAIGVALHELATNAVKYGALAQTRGLLEIHWAEQSDAGKRRLVLDWIESGVSMPQGSRRKGYGTHLIERALPYQLGAQTKLELGADGVRCSIIVPLRSKPAECLIAIKSDLRASESSLWKMNS